MKIGIVGLGKIGKLRKNILEELGHEVASYDPNSELATYINIEFLIEDSDAICICTPNSFMFDIIKLCIKYNKHVFCEKPPGISYEEALKIHKLQLRKPHIKIKFGFNHRYLKNYIDIKNIIKDKNIYWIRGVYGKGTDEEYLKNWRVNKEYSGGGILIDQGIHMLDLISDIVGDIKIEHVMKDNLIYKNIDTEDNMFINMRSLSGIPISMHSSLTQWKHKFKLEISTDSGLYIIDGIKSSTKSYGDEKLISYTSWKNNFTRKSLQEYYEYNYYTLKDELEEFISGDIKIGTTKDAVRIMKLVRDIYEYKI